MAIAHQLSRVKQYSLCPKCVSWCTVGLQYMILIARKREKHFLNHIIGFSERFDEIMHNHIDSLSCFPSHTSWALTPQFLLLRKMIWRPFPLFPRLPILDLCWISNFRLLNSNTQHSWVNILVSWNSWKTALCSKLSEHGHSAPPTTLSTDWQRLRKEEDSKPVARIKLQILWESPLLDMGQSLNTHRQRLRKQEWMNYQHWLH